METKTVDEGTALESAIASLKEQNASLERETAKLESQHQDAASRAAQARANVQAGKPNAQAAYAEAVQEAGGIESKLRELQLVVKGLGVDLEQKEARLRQIREAKAEEIRKRQETEFQRRVEEAKAHADSATLEAIRAYESCALQIGEALAAIRRLEYVAGVNGRFEAGRLLDVLLEGVTPAALEAKGHKIDMDYLRPPYGRFECRLLAIKHKGE
jgi:DNA repair exonuclease SbcCD ATPase subunit